MKSASKLNDILARNCSKGQYKDGSANCRACPANTYQTSSLHKSATCTAHPTCGEGEQISTDTKTAKRTCSTCPDNTFQTATAHHTTTCPGTQPTCEEGQKYVDSKVDERTCSTCPDNTFQTSPSHRLEACTTRDPDEFCNGLSTAIHKTTGACICNAGVGGDACQCILDGDGPNCLECASTSDHYAGAECQHSDLITCNGNGVVANDEGGCTCQDTFAGSRCEFSDVTTCNNNGQALDSGNCDCNDGFDPATKCQFCSVNVQDGSSDPENTCSECKLQFLPSSFPVCKTPACGPKSDGQESDGSCKCFVGWAGLRCECYVGIAGKDGDVCIRCTGDDDLGYHLIDGRCTFTTTSTTTTTTTITSTTITSTTITASTTTTTTSMTTATTTTVSTTTFTTTSTTVTNTTATTKTTTTTTTAIDCSGSISGARDSTNTKCVCNPGHAGPSCEFSDVVTCNSKGTVTSDGSCKCHDPAVGTGPTCAEFSNATTCNGAFNLDASLGYGTATPEGTCIDCPPTAPSLFPTRSQIDCSCIAGYINGMCDDCAGTHQRFNPNSPSFECRAIGATVECEVGRYFNVLTGQCDDCKPGTYADGFTTAEILDNTTARVSDNKLRTTCTQCSSITKINGDGSFSKMAQTSPFGATSNAECFPKFQTANNGDAFCFGRGTLGDANSTAGVSKLALVQLKDNVETNEADIGTVCQTASEGLGYTFTGIVYPPQGCFVNTETNEAAYYVRAADYLKDGLKNVNTTTDSKFAPICERFACISETDESSFLTEANLPDDELECRASIDAVNSAIAIEASIQINKFFPPVAVLIILIAIWAYNHYIKTHADLANHQDKEFIEKFLLLPRSVHYMVWWGLSLRLFDWATDWGFYGISLQSLTFEAACADGVTNMKALRSWSLFFNIVGTILTPIDIWGAHQRMILKGGGALNYLATDCLCHLSVGRFPPTDSQRHIHCHHVPVPATGFWSP